jgi:hypothetical protein
MRNTLNAKYVIGWDLHGYRLRNLAIDLGIMVILMMI